MVPLSISFLSPLSNLSAPRPELSLVNEAQIVVIWLYGCMKMAPCEWRHVLIPGMLLILVFRYSNKTRLVGNRSLKKRDKESHSSLQDMVHHGTVLCLARCPICTCGTLNSSAALLLADFPHGTSTRSTKGQKPVANGTRVGLPALPMRS